MTEEQLVLELDPSKVDFRLFTDHTGRHFAVLTIDPDELERALDEQIAAEEAPDRRDVPATVDAHGAIGYTHKAAVTEHLPTERAAP